jgi:hypothetical protein
MQLGRIRSVSRAQIQARHDVFNRGEAWHLDHILPTSAFDLRKAEERAMCCCWINLRQLAADTNRRKQGSYSKDELRAYKTLGKYAVAESRGSSNSQSRSDRSLRARRFAVADIHRCVMALTPIFRHTQKASSPRRKKYESC